uniref:Transmembrane protein n=1 Tax=Amphora coffeiformis TaxID=265554 RepID=A0A7S3P438_9STRA|mmetsp:Transcript_11426/g.21847  ORF Transcript_11426/g.21847 Transcript_11426/m.21847 type:complete len:598 (-) Transcript_11426:192-1985(-)|eukprot:scaffold162_cov176-Amphora_coffeaeformis.AAC.46
MKDDCEKAEFRAQRDAAVSRQHQELQEQQRRQQQEMEDAIMEILEQDEDDTGDGDGEKGHARMEDELIAQKRGSPEEEKTLRADLAGGAGDSSNHSTTIPLSQATKNDGGTYDSLKNTFDDLPAADIPVPTQLTRFVSQPGALVVDGISWGSDDEAMRRSVVIGTDHDDSYNEYPITEGPPMLLTATLVVEESNRNLPPEGDEEAAPQQPVVAMAEPLEEKLKQQEGDSLWPKSEEKRRRIFMILGIIICVCVCAGVGLGVGFAKWESVDDDDDKNGFGDVSGDIPRPDLSSVKRMYYFLQWGSVSAGCNPPKDVSLYLRCQNGGTLGFVEIPPDVTCADESDIEGHTYTVCRHALDGDQPYIIKDGIEREGENVTFPDFVVGARQIVASCDGTGEDESRVLISYVSLKEELKRENEHNLLAEERVGFCNHLWLSVPSSEIATEERNYGGAATTFLSTAIVCPQPRMPQQVDEYITLDTSSCTGGAALVGEMKNTPGEETVPFCSRLDRCVEAPNNCPLEETDDDPCRLTSCLVSFKMDVRAAAPSLADVNFCSVGTDAEVLIEEMIRSAVVPYTLTVKDLETPFASFIEDIRTIIQ